MTGKMCSYKIHRSEWYERDGHHISQLSARNFKVHIKASLIGSAAYIQSNIQYLNLLPISDGSGFLQIAFYARPPAFKVAFTDETRSFLLSLSLLILSKRSRPTHDVLL